MTIARWTLWLLLCGPLAAMAQTVTAVSLESASSNVGSQGNVMATAPNWTIDASHVGAQEFTVRLVGPAGANHAIRFAAPMSRMVDLRPFEDTVPMSLRGASPSLEVSNVLCGDVPGRFVVHDLAWNSDGGVERLAMSFELRCTTGEPLYGEVRYNTAVPMPSATPDSTPHPFTLSAQMPVRAGSAVRSNWISVLGTNQPVPISITGGTYSLNGGAFTSAAGTAAPRDHIVVEAIASTTAGEVRNVTLTVGGVSSSFPVLTYAPGMRLTGFSYRSTAGDSVGLGQSRLFLSPTNDVRALRNVTKGVDTVVIGLQGASWNVDMSAPGGVDLSKGAYEGATINGPSSTPKLAVNGNGRTCGLINGRFDVLEAGYYVGGAVQEFAADFEQRCDLSSSPLVGEVRINSTVPFSELLPGCDVVSCDPGPVVSPLSNISTRGQVLTGNDVMIGGFVIGGPASKTVVVRARGPSLVPFGIANALPNPTLQLYRSSDQVLVASNDDWGSAANSAAVSASGFAPSDALEAAILINLPPGAYTAVVSGAGGGTGVGIVEVFEVDHPEVPLSNISTRGQVMTGNDVMIGGFVIQGSSPQSVIVRARGPSLVPFGITNALANPMLQLVRSSDQQSLASNDNWGQASNAAAISASGYAPSDALESAILITLPPGAYTAILSGAAGTTGVGIVEVFPLQ